MLYDGDHHYDVVLGEQALYTNIGGPEVMREQIERLLRELGSCRRASRPVPRPCVQHLRRRRPGPRRTRLILRGHHGTERTRPLQQRLHRAEQCGIVRRRRRGAPEESPLLLDQHPAPAVVPSPLQRRNAAQQSEAHPIKTVPPLTCPTAGPTKGTL
ncbi:Scr1 family TA system antitoxin-like transcriptional regulator [Streptomyces sp. NPDC004788]